jgi:hypothetical protein
MASEVTDLLRKYANTLEKLKEMGVVQTRNSPVGDYAEWLVAKAFNCKRQPPSTSGYDLLCDNGTRYQVKARWLGQDKPNRQLSIIRNLKDTKPTFDFLIAVYFDNTFNVTDAHKIPHTIVKKCANFSSYQNGHILNTTGMKAVIDDGAVECITKLLQDAQ